MTFEERKSATESVLAWIRESLGDQAAEYWAWETTPIPCGLPLDEQLEDGLRLAAGEITLDELAKKTHETMESEFGCAS